MMTCFKKVCDAFESSPMNKDLMEDLKNADLLKNDPSLKINLKYKLTYIGTNKNEFFLSNTFYS